MRKRVERYIPRALKAIVKTGINHGDSIDSQYGGYIASFGASVRQAGLLSTTLFYNNQDSQAEKDRHKIIEAIEYIIEEKLSLSDISNRATKMKALDGATALKLAMRSYKKVKKEG